MQFTIVIHTKLVRKPREFFENTPEKKETWKTFKTNWEPNRKGWET